MYLLTAFPPTATIAESNERVLFVPGIMESALKNAEGDLFWGTAKNMRSLRDDLEYPYVEPFQYGTNPEEYSFPTTETGFFPEIDFFGLYSADISGIAASEVAAQMRDDRNYSAFFDYDWRQDNRKSAYDLNSYLCSKADIYDGKNIVIIAHSMGGLVVKYWLKNYYLDQKSTCPNTGSKINFSELRIVFVGTPHYGTPVALKTFVEGNEFITNKEPFGMFGSLVGFGDEKLISKTLNKFGHSFPSAYQLLPIFEQSCFPKINLATPFVSPLKLANSQQFPPSIFEAETWRNFNWPNRDYARLNEDYLAPNGVLEVYLKSAQQFLCELANFEIPPEIEVTNILTVSNQTTYLMEQTKDNNFQSKFEAPNGNGDGTVIRNSAAMVVNRDTTIIEANSSHQALIKDVAVFREVYKIVTEFREISKLKFLTSQTDDDAVLAYAATNLPTLDYVNQADPVSYSPKIGH